MGALPAKIQRPREPENSYVAFAHYPGVASCVLSQCRQAMSIVSSYLCTQNRLAQRTVVDITAEGLMMMSIGRCQLNQCSSLKVEEFQVCPCTTPASDLGRKAVTCHKRSRGLVVQ
jgi:hypothetical protein